jgi:AcrR family transcriptional regulator
MSPPQKTEWLKDEPTGQKPVRSSNRRLEIVRRTARLFVERGFETTSMGDIADANNISKPGLYYHFDSKQALLAAIIDLAQDQLEAGLEAVLEPITDPVERLRAAVHAHAIGVTRADDAAFSILAIEEIHSLLPADLERTSRRKRAYVDRLQGLLDQLSADGRTHPIDTAAAAYTIAGMILWIPKWYQPGGRLSADEVADEVTNLVLHSVLTNGGRTDKLRRKKKSGSTHQ